MAGTNQEADMSSNVCMVESWFMGGEGVWFLWARFLSSQATLFRLQE